MAKQVTANDLRETIPTLANSTNEEIRDMYFKFKGIPKDNPNYENLSKDFIGKSSAFKEDLSDTGLSLGAGVADLVGSAGSLLLGAGGVGRPKAIYDGITEGKMPLVFDSDNFITRNTNKVADWLRDKQSDALHNRQDDAARAANMARLQSAKRGDSTGEQLFNEGMGWAGEAIKNPSVILQTAVESTPSFVPGIGAAKFAQGAGAGVKAATAIGSGTNAMMQGASVADDTYQRLRDANVPPDVAAEAANRAGVIGAVASYGLNQSVPGGNKIEGVLLGNGAKGVGGKAFNAARGFIGEGISEAGEEVAGQIAGNREVQQFDPRVGLLDDVGKVAVQSFAAGAPLGGIAGAGAKAPANETVKLDVPDSVLPSDIMQEAAKRASEVDDIADHKENTERGLSVIPTEVLKGELIDADSRTINKQSPLVSPALRLEQGFKPSPVPTDAESLANLGLTDDVEKARQSYVNPPTDIVRDGDIKNATGSPFVLRSSAVKAAAQHGAADVVRVDKGFVVRPRQSARVGENIPEVLAVSETGVIGRPEGFGLSKDDQSYLDIVSETERTQNQRIYENPDVKPQEGKKSSVVIQNRNRSSPASIAQMQSIASSPDYGRLSFSRDFANGAPVIVNNADSLPSKQLGRSDKAIANDGRKIPVQYAVVDATQVAASHNADGTSSDEFSNSPQLQAIAGNGRIAGLKSAYKQSTASQYKAELMADADLHGIDPAVIQSMQSPVLVRVMPKESITNDIGDVSNTVGNLELSATEQARNDANRIDLDALSFGDDGTITAETVRQFVRSMPQSEQGALIDSNGQPTRQAVDRLNAAIFTKAYGSDELTRLYAQSQDPEARLIMSAIAQVAPKMARLEGAGGLDFRSILTEAVEVSVNARRNNVALQTAATQSDLAISPDALLFVQLFAENSRSNKHIVEKLAGMADFAYAEAFKPNSDMFGDVPKASLKTIFNQYLGGGDETAVTGNLEESTRSESAKQDDVRRDAESGGQSNDTVSEAGRSTEASAENEQLLTPYTEEDLRKRQDKIDAEKKRLDSEQKTLEAKEKADAEVSAFSLSGSDSPIDVAEANGQNNLFDQKPNKVGPTQPQTPEENIERGRRAMQNVIDDQTDVTNAMYRSDLGWIDFIWGDDKKGVKHIIKSRTEKDGMTTSEVHKMLSSDIVSVIALGKNIRETNVAQSRSIALSKGNHLAILIKNGASNDWLLTGFELHESDATRVGFDTSSATHSKPTLTRHKVGADSAQTSNDVSTKVANNDKPVNPDVDQKIQDFGEKIGGAKKDLWQAYKDSLLSVSDSEIVDQSLNKSFPEPNYTKLIEAGVDPWSVAFVRVMRESIPPKPRASHKVKRWADMVSRFRSLAHEMMSIGNDNEHFKKVFNDSGLEKIVANNIDLYMQVGHTQSLKDYKLTRGRYLALKGVRFDKEKTLWAVENKSTTIVYGDDKQAVIDDFKQYLSQSPKEKTNPKVRLDIYTKRMTGKTFIGKKIGANYIDLAGPFDKVPLARSYLAENNDALISKLEQLKERIPERKAENSPRVGADHRYGADVSVDDFARNFGFRAVEFGNYVDNKARQQAINDVY